MPGERIRPLAGVELLKPEALPLKRILFLNVTGYVVRWLTSSSWNSDKPLGLSNKKNYYKLVALLQQLGVRTLADGREDRRTGFPFAILLEGGGELVLDLPYPGILASLSPSMLGVAILDGLGFARTSWGLAKRVSFLKGHESVFQSPIAGLAESAAEGVQGSVYYDGCRYFSAALGSDVLVLVINASEERHARKQASRSWRMANSLKRLGKALTMNQTLQPLAVASAHELASSAELAAVLLWTVKPAEGILELAASVGASRLGTSALSRLSANGGSSCAAELVAANHQAFHQSSVVDHLLTANLEAKFCYLKPGPLSVHPLVISDRLVGVLELVGREGDPYFEDNRELFETAAEHLALALNSAALFEELETLASRDPLTGLANHRAMHDFLNQRLTEAKRTGHELGLLMIDVDHFRSFNEEEGHDAGDEVLRLVAEALKSCLRPYDLAARYGGEEFTVVMPGTSGSGMRAAAERMRAKIAGIPYFTRSGRDRSVTVSIGCATCPETADDAAGLIKAADLALYKAKRQGRDCVVTFLGKLDELPRTGGVILEGLDAWLTSEQVEAAQARLDRLSPEIDRLTSSLHLSDSQREILAALVYVAPAYASAGQDQRAEMDRAEEFRVLIPSLNAMGARFDSHGGQKSPLLARALAVLLAVADDPRMLTSDGGRFDPEILAIVLEIDAAA